MILLNQEAPINLSSPNAAVWNYSTLTNPFLRHRVYGHVVLLPYCSSESLINPCGLAGTWRCLCHLFHQFLANPLLRSRSPQWAEERCGSGSGAGCVSGMSPGCAGRVHVQCSGAATRGPGPSPSGKGWLTQQWPRGTAGVYGLRADQHVLLNVCVVTRWKGRDEHEVSTFKMLPDIGATKDNMCAFC